MFSARSSLSSTTSTFFMAEKTIAVLGKRHVSDFLNRANFAPTPRPPQGLRERGLGHPGPSRASPWNAGCFFVSPGEGRHVRKRAAERRTEPDRLRDGFFRRGRERA